MKNEPKIPGWWYAWAVVGVLFWVAAILVTSHLIAKGW